MSDTTDTGNEPKGRQRDVIEADERCVAVDAGAGSGKTTTMIWRIEHLVNEGLVEDPSRILVLTFANEAAASIQEDINDADGLSTSEAYNISVSTYHSFCNRLVSEYAYQLGIDPDFEVITPDKRSRILHELVATNDYEYLAAGEGSRETIVERASKFVGHFRQEGVTPSDLDSVVPSRETTTELQEFVATLESAASDLLHYEQPNWEEIVDFDAYDAKPEPLVGNLEEYKRVLSSHHQTARERAADGADAETWTAVSSYLRYLFRLASEMQDHLRSEPDWVYAFLPQAVFADEVVEKYWPDLEQTPMAYFDQYVEALDEVGRLQPLYEDYHAYRDAEGALDFEALVSLTAELFEDPVVGDELGERWDYVFCDEFQDTDDAQLEIVTRLCEQGDAQLLAIGDTNQAVYGWRGANAEGLESLADRFDDHESVELTRNFRSEQEILDLVNECKAYDSKKLVADSDGDSDDEPHLAAVHSNYTNLSTPEEVAATVSLLLEGRAADLSERTLGDIAIVVRRNRHAEAIAEELNDRQIPYRLEGSVSRNLEPGLQTLLSYLTALVRPDEDVHLYRVLMLRYRLPDEDLQTLAEAADDSLAEALRRYDELDASFARPERLERARSDYTTLRKLKDTQSLPHFYQRFLDETRLEWFVKDQSREELSKVERFIDRYQSETVLRKLTDEFVTHLRSYLGRGSSETSRGIASKSDRRVNLMTVHQAKGLQFDTVLFPFLSETDWYGGGSSAWRAHHYDSIVKHATDDEFSHPLSDSVHRQQLDEDWRVFHVGATRAESLLVLFGQPSESPASSALSVDDLRERYDPRELLRDQFGDDTTPWAMDMPTTDIWGHVVDAFNESRERHPESVVNLTNEVKDAGDLTPGNLLYYSTPLEEVSEAIDRLFELTEDAVAGDLDAVEPDRIGIENRDLDFDEEPSPPVVHSHTSYETFVNCPRRHLLDHVLYATPDPVPAETRISNDEPSAKTVGTIFHDVAEEAFYRDAGGRSDWHAIAERICTARNQESAREAVETCIDRFFETDASSWEPVGAEIPFELTDVPGVAGEVVGYIDSVRKHPEKGLVVLDYKTSYDALDLDDSSQLLIYLKACETVFDETVEWAGYVYVGEAAERESPVQFVHRDRLEDNWAAVVETLRDADAPTYRPNDGDHCKHCPHRSLGCAPDEYAYDNGFVVESDD